MSEIKDFLAESQDRFKQKKQAKMLGDRRQEKLAQKKRERTYYIVGQTVCKYIPQLMDVADADLDQRLDEILRFSELPPKVFWEGQERQLGKEPGFPSALIHSKENENE